MSPSNISCMFLLCHDIPAVLRGVVTPETTLVKRGSTLVLTCLSFNNIEGRLVNYKWIYPPELEDDVNIMNNVLVVNGIGAEANFTCMLELEGTNVTSAASSEVFLGNDMTYSYLFPCNYVWHAIFLVLTPVC